MTANGKLILIKSLHTLVWLFFVSAIAYVLWSGITGNISLLSWLSVAAVFAEGLILIVFKGHCPLTNIARKYSLSTKDNFDIFLPNWLAMYNKIIFTTLFIIGFTLMLLRHLG